MSEKTIFKPVQVSDGDLMMGATNTSKLLPFQKSSPLYKEFGDGNKFNEIVSQMFFQGGSTKKWKAKEGVDRELALRHFQALIKSFEPSHELKTAACGYLLSIWFEEDSLS